MDPWWTDQAAGWIGGGLGGLIGLLGAGFGVAAGLLAPRGKGRPIVKALGVAMLALGGASLITGVVALFAAQPYHVYYPLLLIGFIGVLVAGINLPIVLVRYRQAEARRLGAEELRRT